MKQSRLSLYIVLALVLSLFLPGNGIAKRAHSERNHPDLNRTFYLKPHQEEVRDKRPTVRKRRKARTSKRHTRRSKRKSRYTRSYGQSERKDSKKKSRW